VTGREGFERIVDFLLVSSADRAGVHDLSQSVSCVEAVSGGNSGLADLGLITIISLARGIEGHRKLTAKKWGLKPPINHFRKTWNTAALMRE